MTTVARLELPIPAAPRSGKRLQRVTVLRCLTFLLAAATLALASWPTAHRIDLGDYRGALVTWFGLTAQLCLAYGLPILAVALVAHRIASGTVRFHAVILVAILAGAVLYAVLGALLWDAAVASELPVSPWRGNSLAARIAEGFAEASVIVALLLILAGRDRTGAALTRARLDDLTAAREAAEARMQVLQAQIEPHFLFNTLANLRRLLAVDRAAGKEMVRQFSHYLEATLPQMRDTASTLGREMAVAAAYLRVHEMRMGDRLRVVIDFPATLAAIPFPPMMIVTLVENALKHGLAPLPEGGVLSIGARREGDRLVVHVADTGAGIGAAPKAGMGIGIANARARLNALYGPDGRLRIRSNDAGGVTAEIELPWLPSPT